ELSQVIQTPGMEIRTALETVKDRVDDRAKGAGHEQRPSIVSDLRGNFYFFDLPAGQLQGNTAGDPETEAWRAADSVGSVAAYQAYLKLHPTGRYTGAANIKLDALQKPVPQPPAPSKFAAPTETPESPEAAMWREVKASGARDYLMAYLKEYPKGKYLALARLEIKKLDDADQAKRIQEQAQRLQAAEQARETELSAWNVAERSHTEAAYRQYQSQYPNGLYTAQLAAKLSQLAADTAYQAETQTWNQAQTATSSAIVQAYLKRYPGGRYAESAQARLTVLLKEEAEMRPGKIIRDCEVCPEMVLIGSGSFDMGSDTGDSDERPVHRVSIRSFLIGKTEITQGQWKAVMDSNPSRFSSCGDDCPVEQVSWDDAQEFVRKLSQKTGKTYRLPSEAEWEYACRAGDKHTYCGSDGVDAVGWHANNSEGHTHPVAGKQVNAFGLYDMSGNVCEWTEDVWHGDYSNAPIDGSAWITDGRRRVLRGGSWNFRHSWLQATNRYWDSLVVRLNYVGFRIARTL
ncbi:MAG: formylglycine-generating enzyme family protein, partial [Rhodoferax sp.]|nr:formylglycine-generating enzyme family protein [Rhodoferax sp.]